MNAEVRIVKTAAEEALAQAYAGAKARLPGKSSVASLRDQAFKRFEAQGLPHRRVEEWRYTDLRALMRQALPLASPPDATAKAKAKSVAAIMSTLDARRLVFVDGVFAPDLSDLAAEPGLSIGTMAEALASGDATVAAHVGKVIETPDPAVSLNTALMGDGIVLRVAAGTALERPILLVFVGTQPASIFTRSLLVLEKGAQATLIEQHDSGAAQVNTALELVVGDEAVFKHIKMTRAGGQHLSSVLASIGARATVRSFAFTRDSALVRNQTFVRFDGAGTHAWLDGVSLQRGREHVDTTLVIDHAAGGCESRERFRSVLDGESRGVFQGKIIVAPRAQKTDARLVSNALLLSDNAEADNKPELEIFADDVQCGHGATAGAIDENLLFYLLARGIPRNEAEALLIQAFIGEIIETVETEGLRDLLLTAAVDWLQARVA
jgi:Fe-S cluster assembly protein SufD